MRLKPDAATTDPHTCHLQGQPLPTHVDFSVAPDFDSKTFLVDQTTTFDKAGLVYLDANGQKILYAYDSEGGTLPYSMGEANGSLGSRFMVVVPEDRIVRLVFRTSPDAKAIQWTTPLQADSDYPVVYTQNEAINGRSLLILPDAPSVRFTFSATIRVPKALRGLIGADFKDRTVDGDDAIEAWESTIPLPLYLVSINIGDFVYHAFDGRSGVWANPRDIEKAAAALARTPHVLVCAEKLFGPYLWGKYDTIVLPKRGFPFGAMEHPRLTSMNRMLIDDPIAAIRVTIHELMHSWFGNLITNGSWEDFWLNEGVTTFGEWALIREALGDEQMHMQMALSVAEYRVANDNFLRLGKPGYTCLKTNIAGEDPDDSFSRVPYVKGALLLWTLMLIVGRDAMMQFLNDYIASYRYTSIRTDEFLRFASEKLGQDVLDAVGTNAWVFDPGLPAHMPEIGSDTVRGIERLATEGELPAPGTTGAWRAAEWMLYLSKLSREVPEQTLSMLNQEHGFSTSGNGMLRFEFLRAALENEHCPVDRHLAQVRSFLLTFGRTLYLMPLYRALITRGRTDAAEAIFAEARDGYHPVGQRGVGELLAKTA